MKDGSKIPCDVSVKRWAGIAVAAFAAVVAASEWLLGQSLCGWEFCYPLDDTYIHMALARQLATSGTWGLEPGVPVFASSSPLWTVVLAIVFKIFGARDWIPLILSYAFAFGSVILAFRLWERAGLKTAQAVWAGIALVAVIPFTTLSNLGMEHALHFFLVEATLLGAWDCLSDGNSSRKSVAFLLVSAALATGARYESLFIVAPLALLFALRRRFALACLLMVAAFLPVVAMGFYALSCDRPFFPASLLMKANVGGLDSIVTGIIAIYEGINSDSIHFHLSVILLLAVAVFSCEGILVKEIAFALAIAALGHGVFARLGWLYRYEAYLIGAAATILPIAVANSKLAECANRREPILRWALLLLFAGISFPFIARSFKAQYDTTIASREIYGQQMQMGRIFATLPDELKGSVAVGDLGCVAYYSGAHVLDVMGLGTPEVADAARTNRLKGVFPELFRQNNVRYAAIYDEWFDLKSLCPRLRVVAKLVMEYPRIICAGDKVLLCVTQERDVEPFIRHLREFANKLPAGVRVDFTVDFDGKLRESETFMHKATMQ